MADAIGPRVPPRPGGLYGQDRRRTQEQIRQLQRPRVKLPRATGEGSTAGAYVYTTDVVGIAWPSGNPDLSFGSAAYSVQPITGSLPLSVSSGDIAVTQAGLYMAWCFVDLRWASQAEAPGESVGIYLNGNSPGAAYYPVIPVGGGQWGVVQPITNGPEWLSAGQYWRLEADGLAASSGDIVKAAAGWTIARLS